MSLQKGWIRTKNGVAECNYYPLQNGWRIFWPHPETYDPTSWKVCDETGSVLMKLSNAVQLLDFVTVIRKMLSTEAKSNAA